jgi:LacI family transcriptional regulator
MSTRNATAVRPKNRISAAQLARAAGVSAATVSYVLNRRPGVSEGTRQHVFAIAAEIGFSLEGMNPRGDRQRILGLVPSNIANPFYPELSVGFSEAAQQRGYDVFLSHTHDDLESLTRSIEAMLDRNVEGVALAIARSDNASAVRRLRQARVPLVQLSRRFRHVEANFVGIDDQSSAAMMMRHALGHQRWPIATVIGPRTSSASSGREEGFVAEALRAGVTIPGALRISAPLSLQSGRDAAQTLLSSSNPPRFILCGADILALGVMSQALDMGLRVPEDVAISGFDGIDIAATPMVGLTGIVQPRRDMAQSAADLLIDHIEHPERPADTITLPHSVRIGTSCGCTPKGRTRT